MSLSKPHFSCGYLVVSVWNIILSSRRVQKIVQREQHVVVIISARSCLTNCGKCLDLTLISSGVAPIRLLTEEGRQIYGENFNNHDDARMQRSAMRWYVMRTCMCEIPHNIPGFHPHWAQLKVVPSRNSRRFCIDLAGHAMCPSRMSSGFRSFPF